MGKGKGFVWHSLSCVPSSGKMSLNASDKGLHRQQLAPGTATIAAWMVESTSNLLTDLSSLSCCRYIQCILFIHFKVHCLWSSSGGRQVSRERYATDCAHCILLNCILLNNFLLLFQKISFACLTMQFVVPTTPKTRI